MGFQQNPRLFLWFVSIIYYLYLYIDPSWAESGENLKKGTQRGGEHGGESRQYHGGAEGTKSDRDVVYVLLIALVINMGLQDFGVIRFATYV